MYSSDLYFCLKVAYANSFSSRLNESPCILISSEHGHTANMTRIMKAQALGNKNSMMGLSKPIMEINPKHNIIESLNERFNKDKND